MIYKLKTPNRLYSGVTEGVPFSQGIGQTDDENIRNVLVNDYKYEDITDYKEFEKTTKEIVEEVEDEKTETATENKEQEHDSADDTDSEEQEIDIQELTVPQLKKLAKDLNLSHYSALTKPELIKLIENA